MFVFDEKPFDIDIQLFAGDEPAEAKEFSGDDSEDDNPNESDANAVGDSGEAYPDDLDEEDADSLLRRLIEGLQDDDNSDDEDEDDGVEEDAPAVAPVVSKRKKKPPADADTQQPRIDQIVVERLNRDPVFREATKLSRELGISKEELATMLREHATKKSRTERIETLMDEQGYTEAEAERWVALEDEAEANKQFRQQYSTDRAYTERERQFKAAMASYKPPREIARYYKEWEPEIEELFESSGGALEFETARLFVMGKNLEGLVGGITQAAEERTAAKRAKSSKARVGGARQTGVGEDDASSLSALEKRFADALGVSANDYATEKKVIQKRRGKSSRRR